jgi:hypothetical protein
MHAVPHTDITQRTYDVKYLLPNESETVPSKEVLENGIKSDRIRLIRSPTTSSASASAAIVQETTGLGKWQTVSVRIINEEEEYERQKQQEREDREEQERIKEVRQLPPSLSVLFSLSLSLSLSSLPLSEPHKRNKEF